MRTKHVIAGLIVVSSLTFFAACSRKGTPTEMAAHKALYHCAMHPQIISEQPGECPICHMNLVKIEPMTAAAAPTVKFYRNPMDPSVTSPLPMKDGMGMDYVPVYDRPADASMPVEARGSVMLSGQISQNLGVTVAPAEYRMLATPIRAAAKVAYDPGLYAATIEHQEALSFLKRAREQNSAELTEQAESTVRASRLRLRQMGLSEDQVQMQGSKDQGSSLLLGSQQGKLWVYASVFDMDAQLLRPGLKAELTSPALPGETFTGTVQSIDSVLNNDSRTLRVRIAVSNTRGLLKPEMYLSAVIYVPLGRHLAVPENAVVDTGARQLVYVETSSGTYEPREVHAGHRVDGYQEIVSGLSEGERVATSANFLIDSESRIQAATSKALADR